MRPLPARRALSICIATALIAASAAACWLRDNCIYGDEKMISLEGSRTGSRFEFLVGELGGFSSNGNSFASRRKLWNVETGRTVLEFDDRGRILFSKSGEALAVTHKPGNLSIATWPTDTKRMDIPVDRPWISLPAGLICYQVPDSDTKKDKSARFAIWDLNSKRPISPTTNSLFDVARARRIAQICADRGGRRLAVLSPHGRIVVIDLNKESRLLGEAVWEDYKRSRLVLSLPGDYVVAEQLTRNDRVQLAKVGSLDKPVTISGIGSIGQDERRMGIGFIYEPTEFVVIRHVEDDLPHVELQTWDVRTGERTEQIRCTDAKEWFIRLKRARA